MNFSIDSNSGWVDGVRRIESPNCDPRPSKQTVDLIVIHGISLPPGEFGGAWIECLFGNGLPSEAHQYFATINHLRVSAHVLITRAGLVTQFVPFTMRAWHAGKSVYCGRHECNDFSIGIELEGTDDLPYEAAQYAVLANLVSALRKAYPSLVDADIVGHSDIAPGRKTDPGPTFDWQLLARLTT